MLNRKCLHTLSYRQKPRCHHRSRKYGAAVEHVRALEEKGWITTERNYSRSIQLTEEDVLISEQRKYQAKRDNSVARHAYIINHLRLKRVAGLLSAEDLQVVNQLLQ